MNKRTAVNLAVSSNFSLQIVQSSRARDLIFVLTLHSEASIPFFVHMFSFFSVFDLQFEFLIT